MKNILYVFLMFCLCSCNQTADIYFSNNMRHFKYDDVEVSSLQGQLVLDGLYGVSDMAVIGNYLCLVTPNLDKLFHFYTLDGDSVLALGVTGEGPNDFINTRLNGQLYADEKCAYVWVDDISSALLKRINLMESIHTGACVVDKLVKTYPMSMNAFYLNDSLVVQEVMAGANYELITYSNGKVKKKETMYLIDIPSPFSSYKSKMCIDTSSSLLVSAMYSINQINYMNYLTGERFSSCVGESTKMENIVDEETGLEKWTYYTDIKVTKQYVYALYLNQDYETAYEKEKAVELHVFDKSGTLLRVFKLNQYILSFDIDERNSVLYGLVNDTEIYSYVL